MVLAFAGDSTMTKFLILLLLMVVSLLSIIHHFSYFKLFFLPFPARYRFYKKIGEM